MKITLKSGANYWLSLARWFEWFFGVILMTTITVITALNYLSGFSRWALVIGLFLFLVVSLIVQFDNGGWFSHKQKK